MTEPTPRERRVNALVFMAGGAADEVEVALYSPSKKKVACVLLAAAFGTGRRVSRIFDSRDWFLAPEPDMVPIKGTLREWAMMAIDSPEDRPGPEDFASGRMEGKDQAADATA